MAISSAEVQDILKTVYIEGVSNLKYQNSPVLSSIRKEAWRAGDELAYAAQYSNGGNFGSNYDILVNDPTVGAQNLQWKANKGYAVGVFGISQLEILETKDQIGAYQTAAANRMSACFDGLSKTIATYMYGGKYGVIDTVVTPPAALVAEGNEMTVHKSGYMKMDLGTRFVFMDGAVPDMTKIRPAICTVTSMNSVDHTITFSMKDGPGQTVAAGDSILLYTSTSAAKGAKGFEGFFDLIPTVGNRTGSDWETYISTEFRGQDRSKMVDKLAGQFVLGEATGDRRKTNAMVDLLEATKSAGGMNNMMVVNDVTWKEIGQELGIQATLWQATNDGVNRQSATMGINDLALAFGDAFIPRTVIDPYCNYGTAYTYEKDDFTFYDLGNVSRVLQPVGNDQLGKYEIEGVGDQGFKNVINSAINIDQLFSVVPHATGELGPVFKIGAHVYGNFVIRKTASSGAAVLR